MKYQSLFAFCVLTVAMLGVEPAAPAARQSPVSVAIALPRTVHYLVQLPAGYDGDNRSWPLLVFLHGSGERGSNLKQVEANGPPKLIADGKGMPFIVVSPQCPENLQWYGPEIDALVEQLVHTYRVDAKRVYLTGLSMGGYGVWEAAIFNPGRYAAIMPVCGGGYSPEGAARLKHVPVWAFHGGKDPYVPLREAKDYVAAVVAAGGEARLTIYPEAGHDSWTETYNNPEVYAWLLAHARP